MIIAQVYMLLVLLLLLFASHARQMRVRGHSWQSIYEGIGLVRLVAASWVGKSVLLNQRRDARLTGVKSRQAILEHALWRQTRPLLLALVLVLLLLPMLVLCCLLEAAPARWAKLIGLAEYNWPARTRAQLVEFGLVVVATIG